MYKVWVLIIFGISATDRDYRHFMGPQVVIDNLADQTTCENMGKIIARDTTQGSYKCFQVTKVR